MVRAIAVVGVLAVAGLFGYFYVTDQSGAEPGDKAKHAINQVGETVADRGMAGAVSVRLKAAFGDEARFVHVYFDQGTITAYGMAPETLTAERVRLAAMEVPGVKDVVVYFQPLPAHLLASPPPPLPQTEVESGGD